MDLNSLRDSVHHHPEGVQMRMVDGTIFEVPHRDYIWFTPAYARSDARSSRFATSFWLHDPTTDTTRFVNALLVAEVLPLNGNGAARARD